MNILKETLCLCETKENSARKHSQCPLRIYHLTCKCIHAHSTIKLNAFAVADRVRIDVKDHGGGLPAGFVETLFRSLTQGSTDELPEPSVFTIDKSGAIRFAYLNSDYTVRLKAHDLWVAAQLLVKQ